MAFRRYIIDKPYEPSIHQVVNNVLGTIQRNDRAAAQSPVEAHAFHPEVIDFPYPGFNPEQPYISRGKYVGENWTSGHKMYPGELMRDEDLRVLPVDGLDRAAAQQRMEQETAANETQQFYPEVIGFPAPGMKFEGTVPERSYGWINHGDWLGEGLSGGRIFRKGELLTPEAIRMPAVDRSDAAAKGHDLYYDSLLRNVYDLLNSGYSNSQALAYFHNGAIQADRALAEALKNARTADFWRSKIPWISQLDARIPFLGNPSPIAWARDRQKILDRLERDEDYRHHVNSLPAPKLFEQLLPNDVDAELGRLQLIDEQRELAGRSIETLGVP